MAIATDAQIQAYVDGRHRQRVKQIARILRDMDLDIRLIDDTYAGLTQASPTWTDSRQDNPPHLLTKDDVLSIHSFITDVLSAAVNHGQYPIVLKAIVGDI